MVQAIINIDENTNRILNILKAKYGLKDKSQAIDVMAQQYEKELLELERIITDGEEKAALGFLKKSVYDKIVRSQQDKLKIRLGKGGASMGF